MSNFGITGVALRAARQDDHFEDCKARFHEYDLSDCDCDGPAGQTVRTDPAFAQVWCDKCDQPATNDILLTSGDRAFRCSTHAWLILAPRGQKAGN